MGLTNVAVISKPSKITHKRLHDQGVKKEGIRFNEEILNQEMKEVNGNPPILHICSIQITELLGKA